MLLPNIEGNQLQTSIPFQIQMLRTRAVKSGEVERLSLQLLFTPLVTLFPTQNFPLTSTQIFSSMFSKSRVLCSVFSKDLFNSALGKQEYTS